MRVSFKGYTYTHEFIPSIIVLNKAHYYFPHVWRFILCTDVFTDIDIINKLI